MLGLTRFTEQMYNMSWGKKKTYSFFFYLFKGVTIHGLTYVHYQLELGPELEFGCQLLHQNVTEIPSAVMASHF